MHIKNVLSQLSQSDIARASDMCCDKIILSDSYKKCGALCCYLPLPSEVQTTKLIKSAFDDGKRIFIPKVIGKNRQDMQMYEVFSMEQIETFPLSPWGIPEPVQNEDDTNLCLDILDLVIVPGMAFDSNCWRLGRGKGYYGILTSDFSFLI